MPKMLVKVKSQMPSGTIVLAEYTGDFKNSFAAYDDALSRYPFVSRIEAKPITEQPCQAVVEPNLL